MTKCLQNPVAFEQRMLSRPDARRKGFERLTGTLIRCARFLEPLYLSEVVRIRSVRLAMIDPLPLWRVLQAADKRPPDWQ